MLAIAGTGAARIDLLMVVIPIHPEEARNVKEFFLLTHLIVVQSHHGKFRGSSGNNERLHKTFNAIHSIAVHRVQSGPTASLPASLQSK